MITAAIIGAAAALALGGASLYGQHKAYEHQKGLLREEQRFAAQQQLQNQNFQAEQQQAQNAYNAPKSQVARFLAAGINPSVAMSDSGGSFAGNQTSLPSGGIGSSPSAPTTAQADFSAAANAAASIGNSIANIENAKTNANVTAPANANAANASANASNASANASNALANQTNTLLPYQEKSMALQNQNQQMQNELLSLYGTAQQEADIELKCNQAKYFVGAYNQAMSQGRLNDAQTAFTNLEQHLKQSMIDKGYIDLYLNGLKASNQELWSRAALNRTNAADLVATRQARIDSMNADTGYKNSLTQLNNLDYNINSPSQSQQALAVMEEALARVAQSHTIKDSQFDILKTIHNQAEKAFKENNYYDMQVLTGSFRDLMIGLSTVPSSGGGKRSKSSKKDSNTHVWIVPENR